ncbi:MAG: hypothetical protein SVY15_09400 [Halobacteriota archaeon]|nr:hypothetical protein [Halobacteriota archaeon]
MKSSKLLAISLVLISGIIFSVWGVSYLLDDSLEVRITPDKEIYYPSDTMTIILSIESPRDLDGVKISVEGIQDSRGLNKISKTYEKNLSEGINNITIEYITPYCSKCTGIDPGVYFINATVAYEDVLINSTHNVTIDI